MRLAKITLAGSISAILFGQDRPGEPEQAIVATMGNAAAMLLRRQALGFGKSVRRIIERLRRECMPLGTLRKGWWRFLPLNRIDHGDTPS
ncbi:hypothetical protein [Rhodopila globiformis]|uniref:hypothetical protein n=1 Tax=Rhodopila globiformis TaxID=1071 RepID=UPI0011AFED8B|nr:hypothetical protein [Rhodopila globiformis]